MEKVQNVKLFIFKKIVHIFKNVQFLKSSKFLKCSNFKICSDLINYSNFKKWSIFKLNLHCNKWLMDRPTNFSHGPAEGVRVRREAITPL
jgi:hypothetical protein